MSFFSQTLATNEVLPLVLYKLLYNVDSGAFIIIVLPEIYIYFENGEKQTGVLKYD